MLMAITPLKENEAIRYNSVQDNDIGQYRETIKTPSFLGLALTFYARERKKGREEGGEILRREIKVMNRRGMKTDRQTDRTQGEKT